MKKAIILPIAFIFSISSCEQNGLVLEDKLFCFDTQVDFKLYEGSDIDLYSIKEILSYYDKLTDNYLSRDINNIYTINNTSGEVSVSKQLYDLLQVTLEFYQNNKTNFNPYIGSLAKKWKEALNKKEVLNSEVISSELEKMKNTSLSLKDNYVVQKAGDAETDLGGVAKGYTLDVIKDYLSNKNYTKYLVNAGSSSVLLGEKNTSDGYFEVGIKDIPNAYLTLKNCFISTSGNKEQGVVIDNVTYSHIINPVTGSAIQNQDTVIVISDKGYIGDIYSTSLVMNTIEEIKNIEETANIKVIVINKGEISYKNPNIEVKYR